MKYYHQKWYAGETISVGIGQGAVAATPVQMARAISGIASGGVLRRPHVVFPDEVPEEYRQAIVDSFPGTGDATIPMNPANWQIITDAMAEVMTPLGTAPSAHLEGIDFAGKTGSAQVVSNQAKGRLGGGKALRDNAWFVGLTPRRNPEIVVTTLLEGGEHGRFAGRIAAQVISAYVTKQRKMENNLLQAKTPAPAPAAARTVDVGSLWSDPSIGATTKGGKRSPDTGIASFRGGHFLLDPDDFPLASDAPMRRRVGVRAQHGKTAVAIAAPPTTTGQ